MSGRATRSRPGRSGWRPGWRLAAAGIAAAVVLLLVGANAHLVYVALASQPDCVAHAKTPGKGDGATFRAARSSC